MARYPKTVVTFETDGNVIRVDQTKSDLFIIYNNGKEVNSAYSYEHVLEMVTDELVRTKTSLALANQKNTVFAKDNEDWVRAYREKQYIERDGRIITPFRVSDDLNSISVSYNFMDPAEDIVVKEYVSVDAPCRKTNWRLYIFLWLFIIFAAIFGYAMGS